VGQFSTPITPLSGSILHADSQQGLKRTYLKITEKKGALAGALHVAGYDSGRGYFFTPSMSRKPTFSLGKLWMAGKRW
jgi:hypothetical protein